MREHSMTELREKLLRKSPDDSDVDRLLVELAEAGLQSDSRFAEAFAAMRQRQGKGPLLIRLELRQKGIEAELAIQALEIYEDSWGLTAQTQRIKKFGRALPGDAKERARQMRFLQARGFSGEHIRQALVGVDPDF